MRLAISLFKAGHVQAKKFKTKFKYEIRQIDLKKDDLNLYKYRSPWVEELLNEFLK